MTNTTNNHTTDAGLRHAHEVFSGDWDQNGVTTIFLPRAVAEAALADRGWRRDPAGAWRSPTGADHVWETGDAIALALAADTLPA